MAMTPAGVRGGAGEEVSVQIPAAAAADVGVAAGGGEPPHRERTLNRFVRAVAFWEWAGNAFGALAFLWATGVLLGGFCSDLKPKDFWFAMVIIFIEAFRIFSRNYKSDNQSLFGTTRALRWTNMKFARMLGRPQEGNEVVLAMGLWIDLVTWLPIINTVFMGAIQTALLILMSKMHLRGSSQLTSSSRWHRKFQLWVVLAAYLIMYALYSSTAFVNLNLPTTTIIPLEGEKGYRYYYTRAFYLASVSAEMLTMAVAALLLRTYGFYITIVEHHCV